MYRFTSFCVLQGDQGVDGFSVTGPPGPPGPPGPVANLQDVGIHTNTHVYN